LFARNANVLKLMIFEREQGMSLFVTSNPHCTMTERNDPESQESKQEGAIGFEFACE